MKTQLPNDLRSAMKYYRKGFSCLPKQYIEFHKQLAEKEINRLLELGFKEVFGSRKMAGDGWCMGMKVLHVEMVKDWTVFKLVWHDGNQEFFSKSQKTGGGSSPLKVEKRSFAYDVCIEKIQKEELF